MLAALAGRDLWAEHETSATRAQFRKDCRQAFDDMIAAAGLKSWHVEIKGSGRKKWHRYHYVHALLRQVERQMEFELEQGADARWVAGRLEVVA